MLAEPATQAPLAKPAGDRHNSAMPTYDRPEDFPEELGFKDAVRFLVVSGERISEATFARMVRAGTVQKHRPLLSKRPYYRKSELQALLDDASRRRSGEDKPE